MNLDRFRGLGVAVVTPFRSDESFDAAAFESFLDFLIEGGVDYLVPCGTTGENPVLSEEEHLDVIRTAVKAAKGRVPVVGGAGSNSTKKGAELAKKVADLGCDAILTITPYYNKPTPDGLVRHFGAQSEALAKNGTKVPMILYNVPGRTGVNMTAETTLRVAREVDGVAGVKEASANMEQILEILRLREKNFLVISGDDAWTVALIGAGADGVVSVAGNEIPREMKQMVSAALEGDYETARAIQKRFLPLLTGNFIESNPIPVKAALKMMGVLESDTVRGPLAPISDANRKKLASILSECGVETR